jgi:hypothetical protein
MGSDDTGWWIDACFGLDFWLKTRQMDGYDGWVLRPSQVDWNENCRVDSQGS